MKTKHLFIILFDNGGERDVSWQWAKNEQEAREFAKEDECSNDIIIEWVFIAPEAIHRDDVVNAINRYIIKPLSK